MAHRTEHAELAFMTSLPTAVGVAATAAPALVVERSRHNIASCELRICAGTVGPPLVAHLPILQRLVRPPHGLPSLRRRRCSDEQWWGVMSAVKRERWKSAVVLEFEKLYEVNLLSIGGEVGAGQMDDLLNFQFQLDPRNPTLGAQNVRQVLAERFGIDVTGLSFKAEVARATGQWPRDKAHWSMSLGLRTPELRTADV
jgi:hypothetical protein